MKLPTPKYIAVSEEMLRLDYGMCRTPLGHHKISCHKTKETAAKEAKRRAQYDKIVYVAKIVGVAVQETPPVSYRDIRK